MPGDSVHSPHNNEIDYKCIAADLLQNMLSELQSLGANDTRAMATAGHDLRQRTKVLTFRLAGDLGQLSSAFRSDRSFSH
jgi:hypothetical protein